MKKKIFNVTILLLNIILVIVMQGYNNIYKSVKQENDKLNETYSEYSKLNTEINYYSLYNSIINENDDLKNSLSSIEKNVSDKNTEIEIYIRKINDLDERIKKYS